MPIGDLVRLLETVDNRPPRTNDSGGYGRRGWQPGPIVGALVICLFVFVLYKVGVIQSFL